MLSTFTFKNHYHIKYYKTFEILSQVFEQQCVVKAIKDESAENKQDIEIREKSEVDRIISTLNNHEVDSVAVQV